MRARLRHLLWLLDHWTGYQAKGDGPPPMASITYIGAGARANSTDRRSA